MASNYIYFIASLPMLHFGMRPPNSFEEFLQRSREFAPPEEIKVLNSLPQAQDYSGQEKFMPVIQGWIDFDTSLRNELAKIRSSRKHIDPAPYLRHDGFTTSAVAHIALAAHRNPSILEGEKFLDEARWQALDELAVGHYFDLDFLIIYAYKLMILERWEKIRRADKEALLKETLARTNGG
jgi:hypothetical protein